MPSRPSSRADRSRAEARRRARLAAQGAAVEEPADEQTTAGARPQGGTGGFLSRLFPPAPPLPGQERPLEGFSYAGAPRLRWLAEAIWLLARNPLAWIGAGALWATSRVLTDSSVLGILMSIVSFGSLIAAGWFGWRRPWLYGAAAALLGWIAILLVVLTLVLTNGEQADGLLGTGARPASSAPAAADGSPTASPAPGLDPRPDAEPVPISPAGMALNIGLQTVFQVAIGSAAGWYGGYLRRRAAQTAAASRRRR